MRDFSNFLPPPSRPTLYHPPYLTLKMWYFISRVFEIKFQILLAPLHAFPFTFASKYKIVPPFPSIYSLFPSHFFAFFLFHSSLHIFPILGPPWILLPSYLCTSLSYPIWAADSILWNWTYGLCCFFTPQPPNPPISQLTVFSLFILISSVVAGFLIKVPLYSPVLYYQYDTWFSTHAYGLVSMFYYYEG